MPRGVEPALQVKLGPGGLSDVRVDRGKAAAAAARVRGAGGSGTTRHAAGLAAAREAGLISGA